jgi:hypothetical protein
MSIEQIKTKIKDKKEDIYLAFLVFLIGAFLYGIFQIIQIDAKKESVIINISGNLTLERKSSNENNQGLLVGSINGNKYHFPWCSGASRIKEENKIWFLSYDEALRAGYDKALNCKGLK